MRAIFHNEYCTLGGLKQIGRGRARFLQYGIDAMYDIKFTILIVWLILLQFISDNGFNH